jgi:hypothetical protein
MRCLFTMFAEDIGLLPKSLFADALKNRWIEHPEQFPGQLSDLWRTMNEGGDIFNVGHIWQFNGGLFADPIALPLTKKQLVVLGLAAQSNWADVEPAIFGTLLERALDPKERHRLGAHYTPRAYVERLVRPTIEEPLRTEWDNVRAQVVKLVGAETPEKNKKGVAEARKVVHEFYEKLTKTRVLDPACGTGNFLYVALDLFKRIENEIIELLDSLGDDRAIVTFGRMVTPQQFLGIEIKPWAKEIAELVLWIGWLQWQIRTRGYRNHPEEPILRDYHNIECRDAVLAYDEKVPLLDDGGNPVTRWDGETTKKHPVTGEDVPDDTARVPVYRYVNPRKAEWPEAEFIVGNPPFIGTKRMRAVLGDGYVEALRQTYEDSLEDNADFVMFWWLKAAALVRVGRCHGFGLITTNSITQTFNRRVVAAFVEAGDDSLTIKFAIPDHPWVDTADGADVRIAMTVITSTRSVGTLTRVADESERDHGVSDMILHHANGHINADLTIGAAVSTVRALRCNDRLCTNGVALHGQGFVLTPEEAADLRATGSSVIKAYMGGKDLTARSRERYLIDFSFMTQEEALAANPPAFQRVVDRVKPERDHNKRATIRERWWRFAWERPVLIEAIRELERFIVTTETSKHRVFQFLQSGTLPDHMVLGIAMSDAFHLGILSSRVHVTWALAAGGRLGVGNDPRYNKTRCFDPFPFPDPDEFTRQRIRNLGEQLDAHRKRQQEEHPELTITGMYNVLEKLRSGETLTAKEKVIHEQGLVSVLKQIHDDLDAAVFDAYGWPHTLTDEEILERLVALNAERAEEERRGLVRWLRPEFQNPGGTTPASQTAIALEADEDEAGEVASPATKELPKWPKLLRDQVAAVRDLFALAGRPVHALSANDISSSFKGAKKAEIAAVLDALAALGILLSFDTPQGRRWRAA